MVLTPSCLSRQGASNHITWPWNKGSGQNLTSGQVHLVTQIGCAAHQSMRLNKTNSLTPLPRIQGCGVGVGVDRSRLFFSESESESESTKSTDSERLRKTLIPDSQKSPCRLFKAFFSAHIFCGGLAGDSTEPSLALFCIAEMAIDRNSEPRPKPVPMSEMWQLVWTRYKPIFAIAFDHSTKLFEQ